MKQNHLVALVDEELEEGTKFVHRETGNGGVSHHMEDTKYGNGAPQEHGESDIRAKKRTCLNKRQRSSATTGTIASRHSKTQTT